MHAILTSVKLHSTAAQPPSGGEGTIVVDNVSKRFGSRWLFESMNLTVERGEFVAILGPNGSGKSTLLKILLGTLPPTSGQIDISGFPPGDSRNHVGYVPQQKGLSTGGIVRGRDFVGFGIDGHRWGMRVRRRREARIAVDAALSRFDASHLANLAVDQLSGGEQQRLRLAQATVSNPSVLLCDEPLLSLDFAGQQQVGEVLDSHRQISRTSVIFVTHDINPVLPFVDRVIYLVEGRCKIGTPDEVLTSSTLSALYRTEVEVLRIRGRIIVVGAETASGGSGILCSHSGLENATRTTAPKGRGPLWKD